MSKVFDCKIMLAEPNPEPAAEVPCMPEVRIELTRAIIVKGARIKIVYDIGKSVSTRAQRHGIILTQLHGPLPQSRYFGDVLPRVGHPPHRFAHDIAPRTHAEGRCEIRIKLNRTVEKLQRLVTGFLCALINALHPPQVVII